MINFLACPYPDLAPIFSLVKYVISIFAVVIPIVLIVLGIIDFSKSVMAKDEGEIKKNQGIFIKRVIYAVAIFFVYTIVTLVMNLVSKYIDEDANSFLQCFNGEYSESSNNNNNDDSNNNNNNDDSNLNDDVEIVNYYVHYEDNDTATKARCCYSIQLKLKNGTFVNPEQVKYVFDGTETSDGCREVDSSAQCGITGKVPNEIRTLYKGIECRIYWDGINNKYVYANPFCKSVLSNNNNSN